MTPVTLDRHDSTMRRESASDLEKTAPEQHDQETNYTVGAQAGHAVSAEMHLDPKAEARLVRKLDFYLVPFYFLMYLWSFIDRINIGNARLYGLERDLGMTGYDYNTAVSVFFVAYIIFEIPAIMACKHFGPAWMLPLSTMAFGLLSFCASFVHSFGALCGVRFLLGAAEAALLPGTAYALTRWYTRREAVLRMGLYLLGAPLSGAFGGLLAYGIVNDVSNIGWLTSWRMLFFIEGLVTFGVGLLALLFLADRPETARFLTNDEKAMAISRIKRELVDTTQVLEATHRATVKRGLMNINAWLMGAIMLFSGIAVQGFSVYLPTIVSGIYPTASAVERNLRSVPPYAVGFAATFLCPLFVTLTGKRGLSLVLTVPVGLIGYAMFVGSSTNTVRYAGAHLVAFGILPTAPLAYGWCGANLAPDASRAAGLSIIGLLMNIGGLISAWVYLPKDAPLYRAGNSVGIACCAIITLIAVVAWFYNRHENQLRDRGERDHRLVGLDTEQRAVLGHAHPAFRLVY